MKAVFKIYPIEKDIPDAHLLIEAGAESISFVLYKKSAFEILGLLVYNLDKNLLPVEIAAAIDNIISNEPVLLQDFSSCTICSNFKESLLIPEKFSEEDNNSEMLEMFFGKTSANTFYKDKIDERSIQNIYRIDKIIMEVLEEYFSGASHFHTTSFQLQNIPGSGDSFQCIVYHSSIKIILFKAGALQLVQYFSYNVALDVAYHLINVCNQHAVAKDEVHLILSGMIDEHSNLYNELYRYFLNIEFADLPGSPVLNEQISKYPPHFFSHLIQLASCVL